MSVKVSIPPMMRQHAGGQSVVVAEGSSVKAVLDSLCASHPGLTDRLFDKGQPRRFVNFFLNDEDVRYLDNLGTPTKDGDELAIIPAVAGG